MEGYQLRMKVYPTKITKKNVTEFINYRYLTIPTRNMYRTSMIQRRMQLDQIDFLFIAVYSALNDQFMDSIYIVLEKFRMTDKDNLNQMIS